MVTTTALEEIKPPSESPDESKEPVQVSKARVSEQKDFSWQKRVYCSREVEFYKKESNCRTQDSKRHHEKIKQILDESDGTVPKSRLYSCVESDEVTSEVRLKYILIFRCDDKIASKETIETTVHNGRGFTIQDKGIFRLFALPHPKLVS